MSHSAWTPPTSSATVNFFPSTATTPTSPTTPTTSGSFGKVDIDFFYCLSIILNLLLHLQAPISSAFLKKGEKDIAVGVGCSLTCIM